MIARHKGEVPFAILLIPFIVGIAFGLNFARSANMLLLFILLVVLIAAFLLLNINYNRFHIYKRRWFGGTLMHLILFIAGWLALTGYIDLNKKDHYSKIPANDLLVRISTEPQLKNGLLRFTAEAEENLSNREKVPSSGNLLITVKDSAAKNLYYGDELLIPANYQPVAPPANPAEFNYKKYLANQNIYYQCFLRHGKYELVQKNAGTALVAFSLRLRQRLVERFKQHMHSPEAVAV
ncbi:MAG: DUF4131 domain-containing protein, partial [Bacteroidetes bacterium]|nr:DUF4131 domain-containing protein [Bacteroidota bacterium]